MELYIWENMQTFLFFNFDIFILFKKKVLSVYIIETTRRRSNVGILRKKKWKYYGRLDRRLV
jgi:hypothetical protein